MSAPGAYSLTTGGDDFWKMRLLARASLRLVEHMLDEHRDMEGLSYPCEFHRRSDDVRAEMEALVAELERMNARAAAPEHP